MKTKNRAYRPAGFFQALPVILLLALVLAGCGGMGDISAYGDEEIWITGLTEEPFAVTPNELAQLECVSVSASGGTEKSAGVNGVGPELDTFLAQYGKTTEDFSKIRFSCTDGYTIVLKNDLLTDGYQIVLAISLQNEGLPRELQPMRLIIPEGESAKWAYGVTAIEFVE